jgi:hypothetical protein
LTLPNVFKHDKIDISMERSQPGLPRTFPDAPGSGFTRIARSFSSEFIFEKAGDRLADFVVPTEEAEIRLSVMLSLSFSSTMVIMIIEVYWSDTAANRFI